MPRRSAFEPGPYAEYLGLSTGIVSGGELNASATVGSLDIGALIGYIFDYSTNEMNPRVTRISLPDQTVALTDTTRAITWWMVDVNENIVQQGSRPTNSQRRTHLQLGATVQTGGVIFVDQSLPVLERQSTNQLYDLMYALGGFNISGNTMAAKGATLQLTQTAGKVFQVGFNHFAGSVHTDDPHVSTTQAQDPVSIRYVTQTPAPATAPVTSLDPLNYDLNGVKTLIPGGVVQATVQHVYLFATNNAADQIVIQYGNVIYNTLDDALIAIGQENFPRNPTLGDGIYLYSIVMTKGAVSLLDPVNARIVRMNPFSPG